MEPPVGSAGNPVVKLESPAHDGHYQGLLAVSGIAYDDEWPVSRLDVLIDGVSRARAYVNTSRPDFCATQRVRGCPTVGFNAPLNLARLGIAPGRHSLRIRATNARGSFQDFPEQPVTFVVQAGDPPAASGALEAPSAGEELSGAVTVKGYAYSKDLRLLAVDVILDGVTYGPATYNQRRDDVCGPLDPKPPNCPNVGFTYNLDTRFGTVPLPNGRHTLQVRVRDEIDNLTLIPVTPLPITINNPANQAPQGVLSEPKPNQKLSGKVKISGYAWDPDGKVTAVTLLIDGGITFPLRYGVGRPDECANLPEVAACPNIGFEGELDTTQFPNGPHVLGIRLTDDGRSTTTIPRLARYGMNVFIEN
jgi:hypothetical protein